MKHVIVVLLLAGFTVSLMAGCTPRHTQGAAIGGTVGGVSGALLDHRNPWRGGVIGGVIGAITGATIVEITDQGRREAYRSNRPVRYRTEDGRGRYEAEPRDYDERTRCRKVRERVWEDDRVIRDDIREVCEGERFEPRY